MAPKNLKVTVKCETTTRQLSYFEIYCGCHPTLYILVCMLDQTCTDAIANSTVAAHIPTTAPSTVEMTRTGRMSWDQYFSQVAKLVSCRSTCHRLRVGCVIVNDRRIASTGYNGFLAGAPHESVVRDNHEQATVHAEQNAIADCARRGVSTDGATCYVTHYPCINCAKILAASGVRTIKYVSDYKNDPLVPGLLENAGVCVKQLVPPSPTD